MAKKVARLSKADIKLIEEEHERFFFRGTPEKFYTDSGFWEYARLARTKDEHDPTNPYKPFPIDKLYLQVLFLHLLNLDILMIPKSRQIMITWAMSLFFSWFAKTARGQQLLIQSKKEDDASEVVSKGKASAGVGRIDCIEQQLPFYLQDPNIIDGVGNQVGSLTYHPKPRHETGVGILWSGSRILALPQGADQVRGRTPTGFFADEAALQEGFQETWETVAPALHGEVGTTKMVAASSVYFDSEFNDYVLETREKLSPGMPRPTPENTGIPALRELYKTFPGGKLPRGMRSWVTPSGIPCLEIHYTADPAKDPATEAGKAWLEKAALTYRGGTKSPRWQREMEINYEVSGGDLVFEHLSDPETPVFVPEISYKEMRSRKFEFFCGYDYGTRNPSALAPWARDPETGHWYAVWELYEPCSDFREHCAKIRACPYIASSLVRETYCDHSLSFKNQQTESGLKSVLDLFNREGVRMVTGRKGADLTLISLLTASWGENGEKAARWAEEDLEDARLRAEGKPVPKRAVRYYITAACPNGQRETKNLKWAVHSSDAAKLRNNNPEKVMDKNNHWFDASAYLHDALPEGVAARRSTSGVTLADYRKQMARDQWNEERRSMYVG